MNIIAIAQCSTCGAVAQSYISERELVFISSEILHHRITSEHNWEYIPQTEEFICSDCENKAVVFRISEEMIAQHREYFKKVAMKKTWAWDALVKEQVAKQMGIDSDALTASQVRIKAYMNPHNLTTDFYIEPVGTKWSEIKKRHSVKEPETECLEGDKK